MKSKKLKETAKPLVLAAAYEGISNVTGSNAIAFGIVGASAFAYDKMKEKKQKRKHDSSSSSSSQVIVSSPSSDSQELLDNSFHTHTSPLSKFKRRRIRSESFLNLVDLLNPVKEKRLGKHITAFPNKISNKLYKLYTAPVEETIELDPNSHYLHEHGAEETSYGSHDVVTSTSTSTTIGETMPDVRFYSHNRSNVYDSEEEHTVAVSNCSSIQDELLEKSSTSDQEYGEITNLAHSQDLVQVKEEPTSTMNINPSAAFGVAAELCRTQMDRKLKLITLNQDSLQEKRRFLHSLYAHAGIPSQTSDTNPLSTPIVLATNYNIRSSGAWSDDDYFYSRISNPTRDALEKVLASAEQGDGVVDSLGGEPCQASCFASGMAAVSAVIGAASSAMANKHQGVHIVIPNTCYDESVKMIRMGTVGMSSFIRVNMLDIKSVDAALAKHPESGKILFLETPDNPLVSVCDLKALVAVARKHGAIVIVDTTWSPPLVTQVFRFGVDAVCFSCTKTMGGHSDALAGAVVTNGSTPLGREIAPTVKDIQVTLGAVASAFDSFLILRGLRTMPVRLERMCDSSMKIAQFLENHPLVEWVRYPGLKSHPQHELAKEQMDMFGQMVTWCIKGESDAAMAFVGAVTLARRATSTGGTETLVQHQRSIEMEKITPGGIIRVSVGLENADDLIDDFSKALKCVEKVCASVKSSTQLA